MVWRGRDSIYLKFVFYRIRSGIIHEMSIYAIIDLSVEGYLSRILPPAVGVGVGVSGRLSNSPHLVVMSKAIPDKSSL